MSLFSVELLLNRKDIILIYIRMSIEEIDKAFIESPSVLGSVKFFRNRRHDIFDGIITKDPRETALESFEDKPEVRRLEGKPPQV